MTIPTFLMAFPLRSSLILLLLIVFVSVPSLLISQTAYSDPAHSLGADSGTVLLEEDFEAMNISHPPPNWTIVRSGYGPGGIWVEESFHKDNRMLRMTSYSNMKALITHNLTPRSSDIEVQLRARISEELPFWEVDDPVAFSIGLVTEQGKYLSLLDLGRSDNQTILPFNRWYSQGAWIPFRLRPDLERGESQIFIWNSYVGNQTIPQVDPGEIVSVYLSLGGGAWYVGQVDDLLVAEYPVVESLLWALALIPELVYGVEPSFRDPVKFSFAHGGKDGHPYPVDRENYDLSIEVLRQALSMAKIGRGEKLKALRRLAFFESGDIPPREYL